MPVVAAVGRRHRQDRLFGVVRVRVLYRFAGLGVDVARPGYGYIGLCRDELSVGAVDDVEEAVLRCLHDDLAHLTGNLDVSKDHVLGRCVVPGIARGGLVVPGVAAIVRVDGNDRRQVQVVSAAGRAHLAIPGRAVSDADVQKVELRIVGHGVPDRAAAAGRPPFAAAPR